MLLLNPLSDYRQPLAAADAETLGPAGAAAVQRYLAARPGHRPTPLSTLPGLAGVLGIGALHAKDEGHRLGLGSFKALGEPNITVAFLVLAERVEGRLDELFAKATMR